MTINHHAEPVTSVAWAADSSSFVTASLDKQTQLCLWSLEGPLLYTWAVDYRIQNCAISADEQYLVTISIERQIFVYNFNTREEQYSILMKSDMTSLTISRDSRYMLINTTDNEVHMIEIETADIVQKYVGQKQGNFIIRSSFGGADESLVVSGSEGMYILLYIRPILCCSVFFFFLAKR